MVTITHTPRTGFMNEVLNNYYHIVGDDIDEIISFCLSRVRAISQDFYKREIRKDLSKSNESFIDVHAGMGINYTIELKIDSTNAPLPAGD